MPADDVLYLLQMALDGFLAGFDDGLETRLPSVCPHAVLSHTVLPDVKSKKVKADVSVVGSEGVCHAYQSGDGLYGVQFGRERLPVNVVEAG